MINATEHLDTPNTSYDFFKTLSSPFRHDVRKDTGMSYIGKNPPSERIRRRSSTQQDKKTIPVNLYSIILTAFFGSLLVTCGYIFNDLKNSYFDVGKTKESIAILQKDVDFIKEEITNRFNSTDAALIELMKMFASK